MFLAPVSIPRLGACAAGAVLAAALFASPALAVPHSWFNPNGGFATTPGNWNPASIPAPTDPATFGLVATYATSFASPADTLESLLVSAGAVTFSNSDRLGMRTFGAVNGAALTLTHPQFGNANYRADQWFVGTGSAGNSALTLSGDATTVVSTNPAAGSFFGNTSNGTVSIFDGSSFQSNGSIEIGVQAAATCSTTVSGFSPLLFRGAQMSTLAAPGAGGWVDRGRIIVGAIGRGGLGIANGGFVNVATDLTIGKFQNSMGHVRLFKTTTRNPALNVRENLYLGSTFAQASGGTAGLTVEAGTVRVGGNIRFAHVETPGTPVHARLLMHEGTHVIAGGLEFFASGSPGRLDMRGGILQIVPTDVTANSYYYQNTPFSISSPVGTPLLWVETGSRFEIQTQAPFSIGRGGFGTFRAAGSGTVVEVQPNTIVADSLGGQGTIEADSLATVRLGRVYVANRSKGTITVKGGATVSMKRLLLGNLQGGQFNGNGTVLVSGAQSLFNVDDTCEVIAPGAAVLSVTADSNAVFRVRGNQNPLFFFGPTTRLEVWHGATAILDNGAQFWSSELALDEGNLQIGADRLRIINDSSVRGTGTIQGSFLMTSLAGRLTLQSAGPGRGVLRIGAPVPNGFESYGRIYVNDDSLAIEDSDGAQFGYIRLDGGSLRLPDVQGENGYGGGLFFGDTLSGYGLVDGRLFSLSGVVIIDPGTELRFAREFRNHGTCVGGTLRILEGAKLLQETSPILSDVRMDGSFVFEGSPHRIQCNGAVTLGPHSFTQIQVSHPGEGAADTLAVAGHLTLDGMLEIQTNTSDDIVYAVGDTFIVMKGGLITGTFASVLFNGKAAAGILNVVYGPTTVKVAIVGNPGPLVDVDPPAPSTNGALPLRFAALGSPRAPGLALDLPSRAHARIVLYDVTGREVAVLADGELEPGAHRFSVAAQTPASGVYFARAVLATQTERRVLNAKVVRLR